MGASANSPCGCRSLALSLPFALFWRCRGRVPNSAADLAFCVCLFRIIACHLEFLWFEAICYVYSFPMLHRRLCFVRWPAAARDHPRHGLSDAVISVLAACPSCKLFPCTRGRLWKGDSSSALCGHICELLLRQCSVKGRQKDRKREQRSKTGKTISVQLSGRSIMSSSTSCCHFVLSGTAGGIRLLGVYARREFCHRAQLCFVPMLFTDLGEGR